MKIVFISVAIQFVKFQVLIGDKLKKKGVDVSYVTYSKEVANFLKKKKANFSYIPDEIKKYKLNLPLIKYLKSIEEKYNTNTNFLLFGDYEHSIMPRRKAFKTLIKNFMFWENYIKKNQPTMVIGSAERYPGMIPNIICKHNKIRYYWWTRGPFDETFVLTQNSKEGHWSVLSSYWKKNKNRSLTLSERKRAKSFINSIIKKKKNLYLVVGTPKVPISDIFFFFKRMWLNIFVEKFRNPYARLVDIARDRIKKSFRKYFLSRLYKKPNFQDKYFFYPLHLDEDCQIIVRSPQYANQTCLLQYISKCLPAGYKLYIKEHPNNIGGLPIKTLKEIKSIPQVKLVSPGVSSHDLIRESQGIITINSTVGWEGLLYQKPVISFGTCFYEVSGMTWKVRDLYQLPSIITKSLKQNLVDKEKALNFVNAVFKSVYPGNRNFYYQFAKKASVDKNIKLIADGIYTELSNKEVITKIF